MPALGSRSHRRGFAHTTHATWRAQRGRAQFRPHLSLEQHVLLRSFGGVRELVDDTGSSPIVQSRLQGFLGVGAAYHF
jgi:outer membrane scaffolding protein for murein synthesis (MipA/OmpV family)